MKLLEVAAGRAMLQNHNVWSPMDEIGASTMENAWAERANHWIATRSKPRVPSNQRRNLRTCLILTGHGISLRVNHGVLEVKNGFTHYPQRQERWNFFRGAQNRPSRIVLMDCDGRLTVDVLAWLSEQEIPLVQLDYRGRVVTALGAVGHAADAELMRAQLAAAGSAKQSLRLASWLVREKLLRCLAVLRECVPPSAERAAGIAQLLSDTKLLGSKPARSINKLLGIEGRSAQAYFRSWHSLPLQWKQTAQHQIPEEWLCIGPRTSARNRKNQFASHPVHAMLNYAYAILESQIRSHLVCFGFDLTIGVLHKIGVDRPALVLDLMEPCRPMMDDAVLRFTSAHKFSPADFTITAGGACRLHPELARRLVIEVSQIAGVEPIMATLVQKLQLSQLTFSRPILTERSCQ